MFLVKDLLHSVLRKEFAWEILLVNIQFGVQNSCVSCRWGFGIGLRRSIKVTLASIVPGSYEAAFSYDTTKITRVSPTSGSVLEIPEFYINGLNFYVDPSYPTIHVGSTRCPLISLVSDKTIVCQLEGIGKTFSMWW